MMKSTVFSALFFLALVQVTYCQDIWLTGTQYVECPGVEVPYGVNAPFSCLPGLSYSWTVDGDESYRLTNGGRGINVIWLNDASPKVVRVTVSGSCPNNSLPVTLTMNVTLARVYEIPVLHSATADANKLCPGSSISLTATGPTDPNSDADAYNNVAYRWSYSLDGAAPVGMTSTSSNPHSYDIPANAVGKEISFTVYTVNTTCPNIKSATFPTASFTIASAPPAIPDLKLCLDGSEGTLVLNDVPGEAAGEQYALTTANLGTFGPFVEGEVIGRLSNYESVAYTLYRYDESPDVTAEGCGVSGNTPSVNAYSLAVTANPNCTSGLTATATGPGSITGFSYSINAGGIYQSGGTFNGLTPGDYIVKAKDAHGCVGESGTTSVVAPLSANLAPKLACPGEGNGVITINVSGGEGPFQYSVDGGSTLQSGNVFANLIAGTYPVYVKDVNGAGCTHAQSYPLNNSPAIDITSVIPVNPDCKGAPSGSISVTANQGTQPFEYSIGSVYQAESTFNDLLAGTYTVTVRDGNDCLKSFTPVDVDDPAGIVFTSISVMPRSCEEKTDGAISVIAEGGTGTRWYSIDGSTYAGEGAPTIFSGLASGVYTISVKDDNECTVMSSSPFVGVKPAIDGTIVIEEPISCFGSNDGVLTTAPSGGTAPYTLAWSNGMSSGTNPDLGPGAYSVVITDAKGCEKTFEETLIEPQLLEVETTIITDVKCFDGNDGSIDLAIKGGTAPFDYTWSNGATSEDVSNLEKGNYGVTIVDNHNCTTSVSELVIAEPPVLTLKVERTRNISCNAGNDGEIALLAGGGVGSFQYSLDAVDWQDPNLFSGLYAGDYTVYVRDANLCSLNTTTALSEPSALALTISEQEDTSCGQANGFATVAASGGTPSYRYEWYDAADALISTNEEATSLRSGDYQVLVYDSFTCPSEIQVTINDSDGPVVENISVTGLTCFESNDGAISVDVTGAQAPYVITWDTQVQDVTAITNVTGGEHWIEILDANECRTKEFFWVSFPAPIELDINAIMPTCHRNADGQIQTLATGGNAGGYEYIWASGETTSSISNIQAGTYHLTVRDSKLCMVQEEIVLDEPPLFEIDAGGNRTICVGQVVKINAPEDNATYQWTSDKGFSSSAREVQLSIPATYSLQVVNANGCIATDSFILETSTELLQADFLSTDEAFAGDTIVLVEISWPMPENISWSFPTEATIISQEDAYAEIVFANSGTYQLVLNTFLGECIDAYAKQITILGERPDSGGRKSAGVVHTFDVHPNPSDGRFVVSIELNETVPGRLIMVGLSGNATLFSVPFDGETDIRYEANVGNAPAGLYLLILEAGKQKVIKRLIIR